MADVSNSIFNQRAAEKLRSPDDLDKYVRITSPSKWAVVAACALLLVGLLAWGVFGAVSTSVSTTGSCVDGQALCFLSAEDVAKVDIGDTANVAGERMTVAEVARVPLSREEAHERVGSDYLVSALVDGDWAYPVYFEGEVGDLDQGVPLTVEITTERIAPISLILG
ncbi:MAG: hypothetical protein IJ087_11765 [Eggerthellaceae bacterium]|nr:hypothetical protein [Eggerthellaceae bacterium]